MPKILEEALELRGGGPFKLGPGQITDDSEMAMAILHGLVPDILTKFLRDPSKENDPFSKNGYELDIAKIQKYFSQWVRSPPFDIGKTTSIALEPLSGFAGGPAKAEFEPEESYKQTLKHCAQSQSNGCLMRVTPLAVWGRLLSKDDLFNAVNLQTALTHQNKAAIDATYLYCLAIQQLI